MELHIVNGILHAMPDTVRAHNAVEEWLNGPDGTVARLAQLDQVAAHQFRAERLEARAKHEEKRQQGERQQDPTIAALRAEADVQQKAALDAIERMQRAVAGETVKPARPAKPVKE